MESWGTHTPIAELPLLTLPSNLGEMTVVQIPGKNQGKRPVKTERLELMIKVKV